MESASNLPEDLRGYIPGVGFVEPEQAHEPAWKTDPMLHREYTVGGKPTKLYTIGALAQALGKRPVTIRKWIRQQVIPEAGLKTQPVQGTRGDAGRRLFTEEQIEAMVRIARDCGVWGDGRRVSSFASNNFSGRVWSLWRAKNW